MRARWVTCTLCGRGRVHPSPVDAPALPWHAHPDEFLPGRSPRMVVKKRGALIKAARMRRLAKPESLAIEMVAELMAKRAQERPERRDLLPDGGPRPDANQPNRRRVVP